MGLERVLANRTVSILTLGHCFLAVKDAVAGFSDPLCDKVQLFCLWQLGKFRAESVQG